ncbi:MAG: TrbI/VirB10 family protein [Bryobacteraceae bacterium]|jgi:type IV secretory pathway VirB10-like protein
MEPHVQLPPEEKGPWDAVKNPKVIAGALLLIVILLGGITTLVHTFFGGKHETAQQKAEQQERARYESTVPPNTVDVSQFGKRTEQSATDIAQAASAKKLADIMSGGLPGAPGNSSNPLAVPGNPANADPRIYKAWADADAAMRLAGAAAPGGPYAGATAPSGANDAGGANAGASVAEQRRLEARKREQERREASMLVIDFTKPEAETLRAPEETERTESQAPATLLAPAVAQAAQGEPLSLEEHYCHELCEGDHFDTVLVNNLDGASPGNVDAEVYAPFYSHDSDPKGRRLLVPIGSRITGEVFAVGQQHQERLYVAFHKLRRPDGSTFKLDNLKGLDQAGAAGLRDKVNNHNLSKIALAGGVAALGTLTQLNNIGGYGGYDWSAQMRNSLSSNLGMQGMEILRQKLQQLPSIQARGGRVAIKVYISGDYSISEYDPQLARVNNAR